MRLKEKMGGRGTPEDPSLTQAHDGHQGGARVQEFCKTHKKVECQKKKRKGKRKQIQSKIKREFQY